MKLVWVLSIMLEKQCITELFHKGKGETALILGIILSKMFLLSLPMSDLEGQISLMEGLFWKSSLWSFRVKKGLEGKRGSERSEIPSLEVIWRPEELMLVNACWSVLLYVLASFF